VAGEGNWRMANGVAIAPAIIHLNLGIEKKKCCIAAQSTNKPWAMCISFQPHFPRPAFAFPWTPFAIEIFIHTHTKSAAFDLFAI